ncbi:MAG: hypothetical protein ABGY95_10715 [Rubritalea sp.]|uniref:hypothetical protein n=1 Tax=Rubritalea sp. TaxID=2109375 RepID=UPI003242FF9F
MIKNRFSRTFQVLALGSFALTAGLQAEVEESKMAADMKVVSKQLKSLRTIPKDDFVAAAEAARKAHEALLSAMKYTAVMVEEMPAGSEKAKALADSRRLMGLSYSVLCELELAYLEKDPAKIAAAMAKVKESKKEGHKKYTDD